jgi:hypothetical protein
MRRNRIILLVALLFGGLISLTHAQKNAAEEKKEAERIKQAEQAFNKAKDQFQAAEKKFKAAAQAHRAAEQRVLKAKSAIDGARDAAEEKLEDSTGLPQAVKAYEAAKKSFAEIAAPLRTEFQSSPAYAAAKAKADEATAEKENLRNEVGLTGGDLTQRIGELHKLIHAPEELEQAAVMQNTAAKKAHEKMLDTQKEAAAIREKIKDRIDNEPGVKKAQAEIADALRGEQAAEREAIAARNTAVREQQQALAAQKHLAAARAANKRDDAQDKKKNNNKGKK